VPVETLWSAPRYALKAGVLAPPALANVLSPLKKVVASLVPVAVSLASETELSASLAVVQSYYQIPYQHLIHLQVL
jgi:hypothetical protein